MLEREGLEFKVRPADVDETPLSDESPAAMVERLSIKKATAISASPGDVVLAADTIVTVDGVILGKPDDIPHAKAMIQMLQGKPHQVMTGVCVHRAEPKRTDHWVTTTTVVFNPLTDTEIDWYLKNSSPLDKAGSYAIQEHGEFLVKSIDGSYDNVVGLPVKEVLDALASFANDSRVR
jgi:septum formation protein